MTETDWTADLAEREAEACGDLLDGRPLPLDRILTETRPRRWWLLVLAEAAGEVVGWLCMAIAAAALVVGTYTILNVVFR